MLAFLAWMCLSLGSTGLICGLAVMGWSMNTGRQELWDFGAPVVFAGQIVLVLGLILQLDRVWRNSRWTAAASNERHGGKASAARRDKRHASSRAFYDHWADGAGPEALLDDLKSQLDLLAMKLSQK